MTNLATLLENSARQFPDRTAVVLGDNRMSYGEFNAASNKVANLLLARGIKKGDKVAISIPNLPFFTVIYYGILKTGATVVPLNVLLNAREIAYHLNDSDAKAYFAFEGTPELPIGRFAEDALADASGVADFFLIVADPKNHSGTSGREIFQEAISDQSSDFDSVSVDPTSDTAVILYTSGTTGQPKGAELTHSNMRLNALADAELFGANSADPDTFLCVLPLFHSFGQTVIQNGALAFGGTIVMLPRFEPVAALQILLKEKVTFFAGVPTMYWGLLAALEEGIDVTEIAKNLRVAAAGGAALPKEVHREFKERFGVTILEGYGLSETSPVASFAVRGEEPRVGSIGRPIPGVEMKLIDSSFNDVTEPDAIGEIAIKGYNVMKGYYKRPEATAEVIKDGWFRTGDLARIDEDGYFYIVDRSKDMIIRGGFNVYPRELEEILMTHPAVSLVAVIGVPHESHGEEIKAVIVKKPGDPTTEDEILAWGEQQFAKYKYPRIVEFVDALPMTSTGKILKRELK